MVYARKSEDCNRRVMRALLLGTAMASVVALSDTAQAQQAGTEPVVLDSIVVEGDPGGTAFDSTSRVLKVALPKAEIVKVRYNCYLSLDDLDKLGLWDWLKADPNVSAAQINLL